MTTKKWLNAFIALNSVIQILLILVLIVKPGLIFDLLKMEQNDTVHFVTTYFISALMIIAPTGFVAIGWLNKGKAEGIVAAKLIGVTMIIAAANIAIGLGRIDLAALDLARAIPITILAFMQKEH